MGILFLPLDSHSAFLVIGEVDMSEMDQILEKVGWSKEHFALRCDVDVRTVHRWCTQESGLGYKPAIAYLRFVARFLG